MRAIKTQLNSSKSEETKGQLNSASESENHLKSNDSKNKKDLSSFAFQNKMISIKRDVRCKFTNITEKFVESILINGDEYGLEEKPFQLDDISLSGTTATIVFQIGKRVILAYVGDSLCCIGWREKNKRSLNLATPEGDHTPKNMDEKIRIYNYYGEVRQSSIDK